MIIVCIIENTKTGFVWTVRDENGQCNPPWIDSEDDDLQAVAAETAKFSSGIEHVEILENARGKDSVFFLCHLDSEPPGGDDIPYGWKAPKECQLGQKWLAAQSSAPALDIALPLRKGHIEPKDRNMIVSGKECFDYEITRALESSNKVVRISSHKPRHLD